MIARLFAVGCKIIGFASAGLLTRSGFGAFPVRVDQWHEIAEAFGGILTDDRLYHLKNLILISSRELTAAGTVAGFHGIPF